MLYTAARGFIRGAIALLYLKVFPPAKAKRFVAWTLAILAADQLAFLFALIFQCSPVSSFWTNWDAITPRKCTDYVAFAWAAGAIGIVYDAWLILVPLPYMLRLKVHWSKKLVAILMICSGVL